MDVLRTHPQVIVGGILRENPFYVPPDEFLRDLQDRGLAAHRAFTAELLREDGANARRLLRQPEETTSETWPRPIEP